ncbi:MAG: hypothetical protein ACTILH_09705 [Corynebacterium casei]|uniref:hypothetical protein n=1 Tax=Corynebacterium casei TaxID=160386 RepID=UPI003F99549A
MDIGFNAGQFLWGTFIFAVVPTTFIMLLVFDTSQRLNRRRGEIDPSTGTAKGTPKRFMPVPGMALAVLVGLVSALIWLTWDGSSGPVNFFQHGMSNQFMVWQVICCGITIIALSGLVTAKYSRRSGVLPTVTVFSAAGFTTFFCFGVSYGVSTQEGVGVLFSYAGMNLMLLITNGILLAVLRSRGSQSEGPL